MSQRGYNHAAIVGNLANDCKLQHTGKGVPNLIYTVAVTTRSPFGQRLERTAFIYCQQFGSVESMQQWLQMGRRVQISGHLETYKENGSDGRPVNVMYLAVDECLLLDSKPEDPAEVAGQSEELEIAQGIAEEARVRAGRLMHERDELALQLEKVRAELVKQLKAPVVARRAPAAKQLPAKRGAAAKR